MYLDHAATSPLRPQVWESMRPFATDTWGNPSGVHGTARRAKAAVEEAREEAAALIGCRPGEVVFTSGGTESANLALKGAVLADRRGVVTSAIEHDAVLDAAEWLNEALGVPLSVAQPEADGVVSVDEVLDLVDPGTVGVVSLMTANNETGILQPVPEVVRAVRAEAPGVLVHTDAVQAYGSERVDVGASGVDLLSLAAHKFGGPKGVGLLFVRTGVRLDPLAHGGGHELGRRSGTLDPMGIVGMVTAMRLAADDRSRYRRRVAAERDAFEAELRSRIPDLEVTGAGASRLPSHSHVRVPGVDQQIALIKLDRAGVEASAGAACASGAATASHVLLAMGWDAGDARSALRFTFGWSTRPGDGVEAATRVAKVLT